MSDVDQREKYGQVDQVEPLFAEELGHFRLSI
jgi:hypothetical protein